MQFASAQTKAARPNIVFILADDLGYGDIGVNGQQLINTPNIDKLAKDGMLFTQFYSGATVCAPSRSALLTGTHTGHTYIRGNVALQPEGQEPLADSIVTITELLQQSGYRTGAFGKWGLGPVGSTGDPNKHGFDKFYGYNCQGLAHRYYPDHLWDNATRIELPGNTDFLANKEYAPDLIQLKALEFINKDKGNQPFFLFLPYILPHAELLVPDDSIFQYYKDRFPETVYAGKDYGKDASPDGYTSQGYPHATFAAMVTRLDLYVGQVIAALKQKGLDKNTLVIFTSDNGSHIEGGADPVFFNSGGGFRGHKRDLYEGGIHTPFIASWPGVIKSSVSNKHIGAFWDIYSTFAELAGIRTIPVNDGISIVPSLTGKRTQPKHQYLYWEFHEQGGKQALRQGKWKAIRLNVDSLPAGPVELYDLSVDIAEEHNLAAKYPAIAKTLAKLIDQAHQRSTLFPFKKEK
ncbi:MAG: arylsulfatase [Ferruginibacter sp.]